MTEQTKTNAVVVENDNSIRVIGAGLGRTGTKSLQAALDLLGYRTYHFILPEHSAIWASFASGNSGGASVDDAIRAVVNDPRRFDATCDNPFADVYLDQLRLYPDAKVVLTIRDSPEKWSKSWKLLMEFIEVQERPFSIWYPSFIQWIPFFKAWTQIRNVMGAHLGLKPGELIRGWKHKPAGWLEQQYEAHNSLVKKTVPKEKLLVFNVKEGWSPLCQFLGKEVPDVPFPHVNESADIKRAATMMKVVSYCWIPAIVATSVGALNLFRRR